MAVRFQLRRDTSFNWASINPILEEGEPGIDLDTMQFKIGDGTNNWNDLNYSTDFSLIENLPTTLSGYGITDAASSAQGALADTALQSVAFGDLTSTPTTVSGYGISDAYTKSEVDTAISDLVNSAPTTLDTLNELAAALGDDANFATTVTDSIATKLDASAVSAFGLTLVDDADAATARITLGLGTVATTDTTAYATAAQGALADTALQTNDNVSALTNDSGYITANAGAITGTLTGDVIGSVFADDSKLLVDAVNGVVPDTVVQGPFRDQWDDAYNWGDHSTQGYLKTVTDGLNDILQNDNSSALGIDVGASTISGISITGTVLDTADSSPLTITPGVNFDTEITVSDVVPSADTAIDLGSTALRYREVHSQTINAVDPTQPGFSGDGRLRTNRLYFGDENYTSYLYGYTNSSWTWQGTMDPGNIFHNRLGYVRWKSTSQLVNNFTNPSGTVECDFLTSDTHYFFQPSGALTVNFTNIPNSSSRMINMRVYIAQGATSYIPTSVEINGVSNSLRWQNGVVPTGTTGNVDFCQFLIWSFGNDSYIVLGQANSYS